MAAGRQPVASTRLRTGICNSLFQRAAAPGYGLKTNEPLPRSGTKDSALSVAAGFVPSEGRASKNGAGLLANPRQAPVLARTSGGPARPTCGWFWVPFAIKRYKDIGSQSRRTAAHPLGRRPATRAARALLRGLRPEHPDRAARFYSAPPGNPMPCLPRALFSRRSAFFDHFFASDAWIFEN